MSIVAALTAAGVPSPEVDARLLSRFASSSGVALEPLVARRVAREPLQLIVGSVGFRYLDLLVRPGVFIPRPETEVLAGEAVRLCPPGAVVVEPCTGSGAIACAVATETLPSMVFATDLSPLAVELARENVDRCGQIGRVQVLHGDLLDPVPAELRGAADLLVCNPPYLTDAELAACEPEVRDWDPADALVSAPDGLAHTTRLCTLAAEWLKPGGHLLLELDPTRAALAAAHARTAGLTSVRILPDLTGRPRILSAQR